MAGARDEVCRPGGSGRHPHCHVQCRGWSRLALVALACRVQVRRRPYPSMQRRASEILEQEVLSSPPLDQAEAAQVRGGGGGTLVPMRQILLHDPAETHPPATCFRRSTDDQLAPLLPRQLHVTLLTALHALHCHLHAPHCTNPPHHHLWRRRPTPLFGPSSGTRWLSRRTSKRTGPTPSPCWWVCHGVVLAPPACPAKVSGSVLGVAHSACRIAPSCSHAGPSRTLICHREQIYLHPRCLPRCW